MNPQEIIRRIFEMEGNLEEVEIGYDEVKGLIISTVFTTDMGLETAIVDANDVHPVERYESKEDAVKGHEKWKDFAEHAEKVTKLQYLWVDAEEITLKRFVNK